MLHSFISNKNKQQQQQQQSNSSSKTTPPATSSELVAKKSTSPDSTTPPSKSSSSCAVTGDQTSRQYRYTTALVYDTSMLAHECTCKNSRMHLETPDRIESIYERICLSGLDAECELLSGANTRMATMNDLMTCHSEEYALIFGSDLEQRRKLPKEYLQQYLMKICMAPCGGFALEQDQDNAWNEETTPIACRVALGSVYEMARLVCEGRIRNGFALVRPPGSHAEFNRPLYVTLFFRLFTIFYELYLI